VKVLGLITDRTQENVERRNLLARKGWAGMTETERTEWLGDPWGTSANLAATGRYVAMGATLEYQCQGVVATAFWDGVYIFASSIVGPAEKFEGKTLTLSVDAVSTVGGGTPNIVAYWMGNGTYEYAGGSLSGAGSVTFTTTDNVENQPYLALFIYVTTDTSISAGAITKYWGLMLNEGSTRQPYVPYTAILPTAATKGAYNYSDLNRVELAVAEISKQCGLNLVTKTDWQPWDVPTQSDMARYLSNVGAIRGICPSRDNLPTLPPSMYSMTYTTANAIETILETAEAYVRKSYRCGDLYCGEV
jgi:hypothetical protein